MNLSALTDQELDNLYGQVAGGASKLYQQVTAIFAEISAWPDAARLSEAAEDKRQHAGLIMSAAREQDELSAEILAVRRARRENDAVAARLAAIVDGFDDSDWTMIRQAEAIEAADRRDDPMKREI